jgi:hypothetical protein
MQVNRVATCDVVFEEAISNQTKHFYSLRQRPRRAKSKEEASREIALRTASLMTWQWLTVG